MSSLASFATYLAQAFDSSYILGISSAAPEQLAIYRADDAVDDPDVRSFAQSTGWAEQNPGSVIGPRINDDLLGRSIVVCRLGPDHWRDSGPLMVVIRTCLDQAPAAIVACDPPETGASIPKPLELEQLLADRRLNVSFFGHTRRDERDGERRIALAVLENNRRPARGIAAAGFRVVAIMPAYNEEDIIAHSLRYLIDQGIEVYLIDNWSTDATVELARRFLGRGLLEIDRFPPGGPTGTYDLRSLLRRVEQVSATIDADWFVLHDADERRRSPWPDLSLKDGIFHADRRGFNCVDHVTVNYHPINDRFDPSDDVEQQLTYFEFSDHPGHFHQRRAWKNLGQRVSLAPTAGHDVTFEGRLVYPFKFLLKHYPIRSQAHGERKILAERRARWNADERSLGWHAQYDQLEHARSFLRSPAELEQADQATFNEKYLVERLSGIGVFREPPFWATPPIWSATPPRLDRACETAGTASALWSA